MQHHIIVMGVSGCGKSTLAKALARRLSSPFLEGDDFHPAQNVAAMQRGIPLNDAQRLPWLRSINATLRTTAPCVLSCSALTARYRQLLTADINPSAVFVYIHGEYNALFKRMSQRTEHYMPASLLRSQIDTLEVPQEQGIRCITVSALDTTDQQIEQVISNL